MVLSLALLWELGLSCLLRRYGYFMWYRIPHINLLLLQLSLFCFWEWLVIRRLPSRSRRWPRLLRKYCLVVVVVRQYIMLMRVVLDILLCLWCSCSLVIRLAKSRSANKQYLKEVKFCRGFQRMHYMMVETYLSSTYKEIIY